MKKTIFLILISLGYGIASTHAVNPYLPLWEHIPDGEPYLFDDPDNPGQKRVYIYGSHDIERSDYCGRNQVVWSANPDSLNNWRFDGVIFESVTDGAGNLLREDGRGDILFAPDVAVKTLSDGSKLYYLYPNTQDWKRNGQIAVSHRPDGPFKVCNWDTEDPQKTIGVLKFDPGVFVDDDGRVYGYWGFCRSYAAELDPETMSTVKPGTQIIEDLIPSMDQEGDFKFFEASSIRKIEDKYVLIYSRMTKDGEWGLPTTNYTLAYAYSDYPLGPYTYGGTIIDARGRDTDADGRTIPTTTPFGNTHGSILEINGQWWVFYHRQTGLDEYARQAMVSPIEVKVEPGKGGKVEISEAELTSEGFEITGLDPFKRYPAGIASHTTGPGPVKHEYPKNIYTGPYFESFYLNGQSISEPYGEDINVSRIVNCTDGSIVGYKYFDFSKFKETDDPTVLISLIPQGVDGQIEFFIDAPWKGKPKSVGKLNLNSSMPMETTILETRLKGLTEKTGRNPLYLVFKSKEKGKSMATLESIEFRTAK
ncbi:MAG: family 43 glycosylhydrolase [Muribaculaceae bacterium]|nr:family 43 glycosylhydrolase [Muribaculaceae bacterium]